jgi:hypothetical protein
MHRLVMKWSTMLITIIVLFMLFILEVVTTRATFNSKQIIYDGSCAVESWMADNTLTAILSCGEHETKTNDRQIIAEFLNSDAQSLKCQVSSNNIASCKLP